MTIAYDPAMPAESAKPLFPPLLSGIEVAAGTDPFSKAIADAGTGRAGAGDLYWSPDPHTLRLAVVFEPEEPLDLASPVIFCAGCALNDCIGALAPPEVGLAHIWPNRVQLNGADWATLRLAHAKVDQPGAMPKWLIVGLSFARDMTPLEPGAHPGITALTEEGCGHLSMVRLIESWSRHLLVWINRWEEDGPRPVFEAWLARAQGWKDEVVVDHAGTRERGEFLGLDDKGAMLLKVADGTRALDLAQALAGPLGWPETRP